MTFYDECVFLFIMFIVVFAINSGDTSSIEKINIIDKGLDNNSMYYVTSNNNTTYYINPTNMLLYSQLHQGNAYTVITEKYSAENEEKIIVGIVGITGGH